MKTIKEVIDVLVPMYEKFGDLPLEVFFQVDSICNSCNYEGIGGPTVVQCNIDRVSGNDHVRRVHTGGGNHEDKLKPATMCSVHLEIKDSSDQKYIRDCSCLFGE